MPAVALSIDGSGHSPDTPGLRRLATLSVPQRLCYK
jgi:hypothetical protein